ncbi:MAG: hypothetical protein ACLP19_03690 [Xanthobacteraceae bacterium]
MAAKSVSVNIASHPLSREENGMTFKVKTGSNRFGELIVSKGGVRWKPRNKQDHHFISWIELDTEMRKYPIK